MVKIQIEVLWVVMPCSVAVGYKLCSLHPPEDGDSKALQNVCMLLQHYMVSQPRKRQLSNFS